MKINEQNKRMKETCSQPRVMCQSKFYPFTTERYVFIKTPLVHLQEVCVNRNTTFSFPRCMCQLKHHLFISKRYVPIRNWDNMKLHILYTISTCFLFQFNLSNLLCLGSFLLLEELNCIFLPSPFKLPSSVFFMATTHLQLLNIILQWQK
jgi:hypothetical protein